MLIASSKRSSLKSLCCCLSIKLVHHLKVFWATDSVICESSWSARSWTVGRSVRLFTKNCPNISERPVRQFLGPRPLQFIFRKMMKMRSPNQWQQKMWCFSWNRRTCFGPGNSCQSLKSNRTSMGNPTGVKNNNAGTDLISGNGFVFGSQDLTSTLWLRPLLV